MFKKVTKIFTKKIITDAKEEVNASVNKQVPIILSAIAACVTLFTLLDESTTPMGTKIKVAKTPVVNKYYIYIGGPKE